MSALLAGALRRSLAQYASSSSSACSRALCLAGGSGTSSSSSSSGIMEQQQFSLAPQLYQQQQWQQQQARSFGTSPSTSSEAAPEQDVSSIGNEKVQKLADEIVGLSVLECSWLSEILRKKLNMERPAFGGMPMMGAMPMMGGAPGGAAPAAGAAGDAPAAEEKKEKTEFAVKLDAFSAEGKIKVIKEIRAITGLGLKEAKELVRVGPGGRRSRGTVGWRRLLLFLCCFGSSVCCAHR